MPRPAARSAPRPTIRWAAPPGIRPAARPVPEPVPGQVATRGVRSRSVSHATRTHLCQRPALCATVLRGAALHRLAEEPEKPTVLNSQALQELLQARLTMSLVR